MEYLFRFLILITTYFSCLDAGFAANESLHYLTGDLFAAHQASLQALDLNFSDKEIKRLLSNQEKLNAIAVVSVQPNDCGRHEKTDSVRKIATVKEKEKKTPLDPELAALLYRVKKNRKLDLLAELNKLPKGVKERTAYHLKKHILYSGKWKHSLAAKEPDYKKLLHQEGQSINPAEVIAKLDKAIDGKERQVIYSAVNVDGEKKAVAYVINPREDGDVNLKTLVGQKFTKSHKQSKNSAWKKRLDQIPIAVGEPSVTAEMASGETMSLHAGPRKEAVGGEWVTTEIVGTEKDAGAKQENENPPKSKSKLIRRDYCFKDDDVRKCIAVRSADSDFEGGRIKVGSEIETTLDEKGSFHRPSADQNEVKYGLVEIGETVYGRISQENSEGSASRWKTKEQEVAVGYRVKNEKGRVQKKAEVYYKKDEYSYESSNRRYTGSDDYIGMRAKYLNLSVNGELRTDKDRKGGDRNRSEMNVALDKYKIGSLDVTFRAGFHKYNQYVAYDLSGEVESKDGEAELSCEKSEKSYEMCQGSFKQELNNGKHEISGSGFYERDREKRKANGKKYRKHELDIGLALKNIEEETSVYVEYANGAVDAPSRRDDEAFEKNKKGRSVFKVGTSFVLYEDDSKGNKKGSKITAGLAGLASRDRLGVEGKVTRTTQCTRTDFRVQWLEGDIIDYRGEKQSGDLEISGRYRIKDFSAFLAGQCD